VIVVDASVVAPALADDSDDGDRARERLRGEALLAPEVIDLEVTSAVRTAWRKGGLDDRRAALALGDLEALALRRVSHRHLLPRVWELRGNVTSYDAAYVALAEVMECPLVTADAKLANAPGVHCTFEVLGHR
jgi:predicted nucleic acid-binding protein